MDLLLDNLPILIPFIVLQVAFGLVALIHVLKHPHYRFGNKIMWVFIVMLVNIFGPILYFVFGKEEDQ
ncbi:PLD nuclease N-terminal domain-containing protein [Sinanaerobacter sp. ZZT-01]|uniref:PLD nuclease N-terminal domain-containing protein n=1 Tax=Sinanaerobacter sp. ZZT-01 TaxID=3111540 RepID=UPI002D76E6D7|nr:PLD nuclease N-terminal domain-containing protein [Sinanaerobacter sp. ZZT-01]WRR92352.1 PLD nuclease N-terminal domain-containing protein [Sinanaerobacter sp. ZZT-01]